MSSLSIETRVGFFVFAALLLLIGFVLALGDFSLVPGFRLHADFGFSGGLQVGAPVKVSGVRVGRVTGLELLGPDSNPPAATSGSELGRTLRPLVRATLALDEEVRPLVTQGAMFSVGMQGVIGESYMELLPGQRATGQLDEGAAVRGVDAPRLHAMTLQLSALLEAVGSLVGVEQHDELGRVGGAVSNLIETLNSLLGDRKAALGAALDDISHAAADIRVVAAQTRQLLRSGGQVPLLLDHAGGAVSELRGALPDLIARLRSGLAAVESFTKQAQAAVEPDRVRRAVASAEQALANVEQASGDAKQIIASIRRGEGSVGGVVQDPQIYDDLKEMLRDLKRNPWKVLWRD